MLHETNAEWVRCYESAFLQFFNLRTGFVDYKTR